MLVDAMPATPRHQHDELNCIGYDQGLATSQTFRTRACSLLNGGVVGTATLLEQRTAQHVS